ncbi:SET domain-containing protein-lysine N-methyltransferase [Flavipsychrobacter stenotrophus]|uniref:SET domain-containing protein-lysine N-methyltransferase n=1 Tax=Flavipsychrobacter stenotrophus TaxID=2077091 RepID=A0A2S7SVG8_9BACT|nr:SET domain-containing protein [Flavipsychrobacter stenotrophus]PQJ10932.1 SET domain-containing protein-lysine N-methyltransferase [Flavipsychrobacter stenotrophus]
MINPHLYFADTDKKGRGVFTKAALEADLVIESSPVIVMSNEDRQKLDDTLLHDYIFEWQPDGAKMCCMALGWVPLYNHSYASNCEYFMDYDNNTMYIQTARAIAEGEELTINYNGDWDNEEKVWFDVS